MPDSAAKRREHLELSARPIARRRPHTGIALRTPRHGGQPVSRRGCVGYDAAMASSAQSAASGSGLPGEGELRTRLENALVALFKRHYGKGPAAAKAIMRDEYVIVVLEGGLTRNEETLLEHGHEEEVRRFRLIFEQSVRDLAMRAVGEATGCEVVAYHSQVIFDPFRSFELFVLGSQASLELPGGLADEPSPAEALGGSDDLA